MRDITIPVIFVMLILFLVFNIFQISDYSKMIEEQQETIAEYSKMTEEALNMVDTWKSGYRELQEEHSQALEYIEQLEYETEMWINEN